jgi:hypothetical protein
MFLRLFPQNDQYRSGSDVPRGRGLAPFAHSWAVKIENNTEWNFDPRPKTDKEEIRSKLGGIVGEENEKMPKKRHAEEQIVAVLRQVEA